MSCLEKERLDFCKGCWDEGGAKEGSVWSVKVPPKRRGNKRRFVDLFDRGLALLETYIEQGDPKAYTLALYLQRQGALHRLRKVGRKRKLALFEVAETQETFAIPIADPPPPGAIEKDLMQALTGE